MHWLLVLLPPALMAPAAICLKPTIQSLPNRTFETWGPKHALIMYHKKTELCEWPLRLHDGTCGARTHVLFFTRVLKYDVADQAFFFNSCPLMVSRHLQRLRLMMALRHLGL